MTVREWFREMRRADWDRDSGCSVLAVQFKIDRACPDDDHPSGCPRRVDRHAVCRCIREDDGFVTWVHVEVGFTLFKPIQPRKLGIMTDVGLP